MSVQAGIGFILAGMAVFIVGVSMRPPGVAARWSWRRGFLESSTQAGFLVGGIGIVVFCLGAGLLAHSFE